VSAFRTLARLAAKLSGLVGSSLQEPELSIPCIKITFLAAAGPAVGEGGAGGAGVTVGVGRRVGRLGVGQGGIVVKNRPVSLLTHTVGPSMVLTRQ
jgi:hypothetical protein